MSIDDVLKQIQANLNLEAEAEHEVLEEIRGHLEEAVMAARAHGLSEEEALIEAARGLGVEQTVFELHKTRAGWGVWEGVAAAALPVLFTLILRWIVFAPGGTVDQWREMLSPLTFAIIAGAAILIPLMRFPQRRYAIALWIFFWSLSIITVVLPTLRW